MQGRVADVLDQAREHRSRFDEAGLLALLGKQIGRGAGNDQFADQIDELVELVGLDADKTRFLGFLVADLALLDHGSINQLLVYHLVFDQDFTELVGLARRSGRRRRSGRFLVEQALVYLGLGEGATADQDFAEPHAVFR